MEYLFSQGNSFEAKDGQKQRMLGEIDRVPESDLMNTQLDQWAEHFVSKFKFDVPVLDEQNISAETNDVQADPRSLQDQGNMHFMQYGGMGPSSVSATEFVFYVPFTGDSQLFYLKPSSFTTTHPRAQVTDSELVFRYTFGSINAQGARSKFDSELGNVRRYMTSLSNDLNAFNNDLKGVAQSRLQERFQKFKKVNEAATTLGFPIRRRDSAPKTFAVQSIKRKILPRPQASSAEKMEPSLALSEYEHILSVLKNMVSVMELSPHAFKGMEEEHLRSHFLVALNSQYEGQATGETFNFEGKTDILIKCEGKNIFVAECKFWKGGAVFSETINQLLGYASWRDTKTAILIFNRNKDLSNVLKQIPGLVKGHANYLRDGKSSNSETEFNFLLHHRDDKRRELHVAVQVYEIPT